MFIHINDQTVLFQTIQFSISHLLCLNVKHFNSTHRILSCVTTQSQIRPGSDGNEGVQYYWNLTIRLFSVISRTLVGWELPLCRDAASVFYSPSWVGHRTLVGGVLPSAEMISVYVTTQPNGPLTCWKSRFTFIAKCTKNKISIRRKLYNVLLVWFLCLMAYIHSQVEVPVV